FSQREGTQSVEIGAGFLEIRHDVPYSGWEALRPLILQMYSARGEVALLGAVREISLRYINRLEIPDSFDALSEVITMAPVLHGDLERPLERFYQEFVLRHDDPVGVLVHRSGIPSQNDTDNVVMVDLEFISTLETLGSEVDAVHSWLDAAHDVVLNSFRASLAAKFYHHLEQGA
ncbi:MAG: TIGR04255 family protein, partial [Bradymonadaceae bacterium]